MMHWGYTVSDLLLLGLILLVNPVTIAAVLAVFIAGCIVRRYNRRMFPFWLLVVLGTTAALGAATCTVLRFWVCP